jgi:hypothetical protein
MEMWLQLRDRDGGVHFSDGVTYEVHASGVLEIASGTDIHLYSPAYWEEVTVDTRTADQRESHAEEITDDVRWQ